MANSLISPIINIATIVASVVVGVVVDFVVDFVGRILQTVQDHSFLFHQQTTLFFQIICATHQIQCIGM